MSSGIPESVHDLTKVRNSGLLLNLFPGELVLSDKATLEKLAFTILLNLQQQQKKSNSIQQLVVSAKLWNIQFTELRSLALHNKNGGII